MDYKFLGMYLESVLDMYKKGEFAVMSNPEKAVVEQLLKKCEEMKKEG